MQNTLDFICTNLRPAHSCPLKHLETTACHAHIHSQKHLHSKKTTYFFNKRKYIGIKSYNLIARVMGLTPVVLKTKQFAVSSVSIPFVKRRVFTVDLFALWPQ